MSLIEAYQAENIFITPRMWIVSWIITLNFIHKPSEHLNSVRPSSLTESYGDSLWKKKNNVKLLLFDYKNKTIQTGTNMYKPTSPRIDWS